MLVHFSGDNFMSAKSKKFWIRKLLVVSVVMLLFGLSSFVFSLRHGHEKIQAVFMMINSVIFGAMTLMAVIRKSTTRGFWIGTAALMVASLLGALFRDGFPLFIDGIVWLTVGYCGLYWYR